MTDDHTSAVSAPVDDNSNKTVFNFFGLPRELRNLIYSMLTHDVEVDKGHDETGEKCGFHITIEEKNLLTPLLLNRQISQEYLEEVQGRQRLLLGDVGAAFSGVEPGEISKNSTRALVRLLLLCSEDVRSGDDCNCVRDAEEHVKWIGQVFETLSLLRDVKVEVRPCSTAPLNSLWDFHGEAAMEVLRKVENLRCVQQIEVYPVFGHETDRSHKAYEDQRPAVTRWTRTNGWDKA